ncbi:MAG: SCO family protein [Paracoccaceae bacterium]
MTKLYAILAAVVAAAFLGGSAWWVLSQRNADPYAACRAGATGGEIGGPFTLTDQTGKTVTDKDVITGPTLVYFGYTFCPDVCPLDNARNAEAVDILEENGFEVTPVFISIDPDRDTPQVMADYAAAIHPRLIGLTGTAEQVKAAAQAYKVYYRKPDTAEEFYTVDHSTFTYLMMPGNRFLDFFNRDVTADKMAERVGCFLNAG